MWVKMGFALWSISSCQSISESLVLLLRLQYCFCASLHIFNRSAQSVFISLSCARLCFVWICRRILFASLVVRVFSFVLDYLNAWMVSKGGYLSVSVCTSWFWLYGRVFWSPTFDGVSSNAAVMFFLWLWREMIIFDEIIQTIKKKATQLTMTQQA